MKTNDFNQAITSTKLKENLEKQFGTTVNLGKYSREQLEDIRNKLRTRVFQQEGAAGINDLLTNETYQKDKAMLQLLNTRIKEMLGENIKRLRDKMIELSEGKKDTKAKKDYDGDGKIETGKEEHAGSVDKAIKKAKAEKDVAEGTEQHSRARTWAQITSLEKQAKAASSPIKKHHYMKMAADLRSSLPTSDDVAEGFPTVADAQKRAEARAGLKNKNVDEGSVKELDADLKDKAMSADEFKQKYKMTRAEARAGLKNKNVDEGSVKELDADLKDKSMSADEFKQRYKMTRAEARAELKNKQVTEGSVKELDADLKDKAMSADEFKQKYKMTRAEARAGLKNKNVDEAVKPRADMTAKEKSAVAKKALAKKSAKNESQESFRVNVRMVNEGLGRFLAEDEEGKAKAITAAGDMVNDFTSWMQRVGQYQTKSMIELTDAIKADFGVEQAELFKATVGPALSATLEVLTAQREAVSNAVASLASGEPTEEPMGQEPEMDTGMDQAAPDEMNAAPEDEFSASDAGSGAGTSGREMRESAPQRRARKLAESHSIMAKLSK